MGWKQSLRSAVREFVEHPSLNISVVVILALAIGANISVFTFIDLLSSKTIPGREPHRLISLWTGDEDPSLDGFGWNSYPDFEYYRDHSEALDETLAWMVNLASLTSDGQIAQWTECWSVSGNYFQLLGIPMFQGRPFGPADDLPGAARVAVISHSMWQSRFGGDPEIIGKELRLNGHTFSIRGVAPQGFRGNWAARQADLWVPIRNTDVLRSPELEWLEGAGIRWLGVLGRLKDGISLETARQELQRRAEELQKLHPDAKRHRRARVVAARMVPPSEKSWYLPPARMLGGAVALLLLIACANTAILLLVRGSARSREIATRLAVGASRTQIVQQLLGHSLLLSLCGGLGGIGIAALGHRFIGHHVEAYGPGLRFDTKIFGFAVLVAVTVPLVSGLAPAWMASRTALVDALKQRSSTLGGKGLGGGLRHGLVVLQIALALVLTLGAALLYRSMENRLSIELGFEPANVLMAQVNLAQKGLSPSEGRVVFQEILDRLQAVPGVETASLVRFAPIEGIARSVDVVSSEASDQTIAINYNIIAPHYFAALGIPLLEGSDLQGEEIANGPGVIVLNRAAAEALWPGEQALGRSLQIERLAREGHGARFEVVGIVADSLYEEISHQPPEPLIYLSFHQVYQSKLKLLAKGRTEGSMPSPTPLFQDVLATVDPDLALGEVTSLPEYVRGSIWEARMYAQVTGVLALLGLVVAVLGVSSVVRFSVSRRTHELGLRTVLGARPRDLVTLLLRQGVFIVVPGLLLGLLLSAWATRWISGLLFGIRASDPLTFVAVSFGWLALTLGVCYLPARRAARREPLESIRWE